MLPWALLWSICFLLWHVFAGKIAVDLAIYAAAGATIATAAARVVFREHLAPLRTHWRCVAQAFRLPKLMVTGSWEVLAVLARQIFRGRPAESLVFTVPFDVGDDDDESAFRRALAIAYATATPNFVVIGIDRERGLLVYHQIQKSEVPKVLVRLGAKP